MTIILYYSTHFNENNKSYLLFYIKMTLQDNIHITVLMKKLKTISQLENIKISNIQ